MAATYQAVRDDQAALVLRRAADTDRDLKDHPPIKLKDAKADLVDALYATAADAHAPGEIFDRLRWGGQVVFITNERNQASRLALQYASGGFEITQAVRHITQGFLRLPIPFFSRKVYYFVARKVQLVHPGETTERFTYHVHLDRPAPHSPYVVVKEVPSLELVMARLRGRWPELPDEIIEKRARKFSDKIFPTFLTREAAILKIVHRDLPEPYRERLPKVLTMEQDSRGYVRRLHLNWLRNGGEPLSQLEFARQSADLLRILHDHIGVMHLDLRLDNFVITPKGVGFVDFGSSVRVDENLKENPLLSSLFEELMRTSEIQRMLLNMTRTGQVTSDAISCGLHKVDKAVDYFYLAVQISAPHSNPDLKGLIEFNKNSEQAKALATLTQKILRPTDPTQPEFRSAADILRGIEQIEQSLGRTRQIA